MGSALEFSSALSLLLREAMKTIDFAISVVVFQTVIVVPDLQESDFCYHALQTNHEAGMAIHEYCCVASAGITECGNVRSQLVLISKASLTMSSAVFIMFQDLLIAADFGTVRKGRRGGTPVPALLAMLLVGTIYLLPFLYDTLATRNTFQAMALSIYSSLLLLFSGLQINQIEDSVRELSYFGERAETAASQLPIRSLLIANTAVNAALLAAQIGLTLPLSRLFGGVIFKQLDANPGLRKKFTVVQVCREEHCRCRNPELKMCSSTLL